MQNGLRTLFTIFLLYCTWALQAQSQEAPSQSRQPEAPAYPSGYFRLPMNLPVSLSGSFGELRSNHFHTGLDFRTRQTTGHPVYAAADGYISRLSEGAWGYGKAVYIDHPNGYTTVYGHLERFMPAAAREIKAYQYANETFEANIHFPPGKLSVKKGEVIAWSGNSGSSGGPHLHFEIRDTESEEPINPLLFGMPVPDHVAPVLGGLFIYPLTDSSTVNGSHFRAGFSITNSGNDRYVIRPSQNIKVHGRIGFGIIATDQFDGAPNRNGNYSIELKRDGHTIYYSETDRINFDHNRAMNSHIDYGAWLMDGRRIQKSFVSPGNSLGIYKRLSNKGSAWFSGSGSYEMEYVVGDVAGNRSTLKFTLSVDPGNAPPKREELAAAHFSYDQPNQYTAPEFRLDMKAGTLYEDLAFRYSSEAAPSDAVSAMHRVHSRTVPADDYFDIHLKTRPGFNDTTKALIVNEKRKAFATRWENGWAIASVREFGDFYVTTDSKAPTIRPVTISNGKNMSGNSGIVLRISDDLSGLKSYTGRIDGKWVLMELDGKTGTLKHVFDERTPVKGEKHSFQLIVTDMKNNTAEYKAAFTR